MSIYGITAGASSPEGDDDMSASQGLVTNPATANYSDGATAYEAIGKGGEVLVSQIHGQIYEQTYRGAVFNLTTATAGTIIPVQATNLVSTFTLWNPAGSGKNLELIRYSLGVLNATTVVGDVSLYFQSSVGSAVTAPGTLTGLTIRSNLLGSGGVSVASGYSAATLVNAIGTNCFRAAILTSFGAVTTTNAAPINYDFLGSIIVPPGCLITTAGNAAQTQAMAQSLSWIETPL